MASIIDERGFNQGFKLTPAQGIRLRRRAQAIINQLPTPVSPERPYRILELGCGTGELAYELVRLTEGQVTGVDLSAKFIAQANVSFRHPRLDFIVSDLSKTDPTSESDCYDCIVGNGILHHLYHHLDSFLPVLYRWLRPGGRLVFWEPNLCNPYVWLIFSFSPLRRRAKLEPDEMAFTPAFIRSKLQACGFSPITISTRDFLLPNTPNRLIRPAILLSNMFDRVPGIRRAAQSLFITADREIKIR